MKIDIFSIMFFIVAGIALFASISNIRLINEYNNQGSQCVLFDAYKNDYNRNIADGLYWTGTDFYCVWAKDRNLKDIEKTDRHEYCHYLVDNDYNHFCEDWR